MSTTAALDRPIDLKADFPGLVNADGSPWHYLDSAATAQKPFIARWTKQTDSYAARDWKLRRLQDGGDRDRDAPRAPPPPPPDVAHAELGHGELQNETTAAATASGSSRWTW